MLEAALAEGCRECLVRVERIDDDLPGDDSRERRTHERVADLVVDREHRPDLVEEPAPPAKTVLGDAAISGVEDVAVVGRLVKGPLDKLPPRSTGLLVLLDHDLQVACGQSLRPRRLIGIATFVPGTWWGGEGVTRERRLVFKTMALIEWSAQWSSVEANREFGSDGAHCGLEQRASDPSTAIGWLHEHHRDPPVAAVIDANRAADDTPVSFGGEAPVGSHPKEHAPVVGRLIPTGDGTQPACGFEVVDSQLANERIAQRFHALTLQERQAPMNPLRYA
jgi:hypothetical protein